MIHGINIHHVLISKGKCKELKKHEQLTIFSSEPVAAHWNKYIHHVLISKGKCKELKKHEQLTIFSSEPVAELPS